MSFVLVFSQLKEAEAMGTPFLFRPEIVTMYKSSAQNSIRPVEVAIDFKNTDKIQLKKFVEVTLLMQP